MKKRKNTGRRVLIIIAVTAILAVILGIGGFIAYRVMCQSSYQGEPVRIYIPAGSSSEAVADTLERLGSFGSKAAMLWKMQKGNPARAHGSFVVDSTSTAIGLSRRILQGNQSPLRFTFNNIRTIGELWRRAGQVFEADSAGFALAADTVLGAKAYEPSGYPAAFIPDTYEFYWTSSPADIITSLERTRTDFWTEDRLTRAQSLGLSPVEVATIASIVEEETNKSDERPIVARLYLNRLAQNMPLQADPTVRFALGDFSLRRINGTHLTVQSPYNTYLAPGLPPGPIRIAEKATLQAVLDAPEHRWLYMCAKPDFSGYHNFAATYDRHRINAALYHRALTARGIR